MRALSLRPHSMQGHPLLYRSVLHRIRSAPISTTLIACSTGWVSRPKAMAWGFTRSRAAMTEAVRLRPWPRLRCSRARTVRPAPCGSGWRLHRAAIRLSVWSCVSCPDAPRAGWHGPPRTPPAHRRLKVVAGRLFRKVRAIYCHEEHRIVLDQISMTSRVLLSGQAYETPCALRIRCSQASACAVGCVSEATDARSWFLRMPGALEGGMLFGLGPGRRPRRPGVEQAQQ